LRFVFGVSFWGALAPRPTPRHHSHSLMKVDDDGRIVQFAEKPTGAALDAMAVDTTALGLAPGEAADKPFIASMGIYVFRKVGRRRGRGVGGGSAFFVPFRAARHSPPPPRPRQPTHPPLLPPQDVLATLLRDKYASFNDFGGEIIPAAAAENKVVAYLFNDYWEDIGTVREKRGEGGG